jgi:hypothetical protein
MGSILENRTQKQFNDTGAVLVERVFRGRLFHLVTDKKKGG